LELFEAIQELRAGRTPISATIARALVRRMSAPAPAHPGPELTPPATDTIKTIATGVPYSELAEWPGNSRQTVPVHIKNIYRKLAANNRSEAVYEAQKRGLIRL